MRSLDEAPVVFNEYDTDEFRDFIATCADFAAKGYIPANELTQPIRCSCSIRRRGRCGTRWC
ncbi:MAG: hypothetical protein MR399_13065 [Clostridiales bacterium]|nr:hypothetical protein [Clostridiales bacterium]